MNGQPQTEDCPLVSVLAIAGDGPKQEVLLITRAGGLHPGTWVPIEARAGAGEEPSDVAERLVSERFSATHPTIDLAAELALSRTGDGNPRTQVVAYIARHTGRAVAVNQGEQATWFAVDQLPNMSQADLAWMKPVLRGDRIYSGWVVVLDDGSRGASGFHFVPHSS